ncbi:MAG TPA: fluoride efflux transporter CrcB, partial [Acidimicrobiales bacterium]|nr:fluoride efflux transporter CrcB [Acidimicrobiales bacterium]
MADDWQDVARVRRRAAPTRADMRVLLAIAVGGMIGATLRYKLATLIHVPAGHFPWATFWTNVSGSLILGFLLVLLIERFPPTRYARAFAGTGVLGAYTTFSTFSVETDVLVKDGHAGVAGAYVVGSLVVGLGAAASGVVLARRLTSRRER